MREQIDVAFDVRSDTPAGRDPDSHSRTLGRYHQLLWSKELPNGESLDLVATAPPVYLHHCADFGEFWLSSDSAIHTYTRWTSTSAIIEQVPEEDNEAFRHLTSTIGAMMIWPANRIDGKPTINGARGFTRSISDRFDLTIECVRRYYIGQVSPLYSTLDRYRDFFQLFSDFRGFIEFFLLHDIVSPNYSTVSFFIPFDDFATHASVPTDLSSYLEYRRRASDFVCARNARINQLASRHGKPPNTARGERIDA